MEQHKKQIVAAVIIAVIFILLFTGYAALYFSVPGPAILRILAGGLMTVFAVGMVFVLIERIQEIKKGENDDLDNY